METTKRIVILLALGLLAVVPAQSAEKQARRISNTHTASCLVKITCDPAILPLNFQTVDYLLRSSGVGGKAAREALEFSTDEVYDLFSIEYVQSLTSDAHSGIPVLRSRRSRSDIGKSGVGRMEGGEMDEYMYEMMMENEMSMEGGELPPSFPGSSPTVRTKSSSSRTRSRGGATRTPPPTLASSADGQTYLLSLDINLPQEVKPAAKEFMNALVENLRRTLLDAYNANVEELRSQLNFAERLRDMNQTELAEATEQVEAIKVTPSVRQSPADIAVNRQLEQIVDLSNLTQPMTFEDVIIELKHSVDPPLQMQPNWRNLLEMAEIEPTTPSMMDPLPGIKLRKGLELLLAGVSSETAQLGYVVDEGVIVIATVETLPRRMIPFVYDLGALAHSARSTTELVQTIQQSIEPESWSDLSENGEGTISVYMGKKLAIRQTFEVHGKVTEFLRSMTANIPASTPLQIPPEMIVSEKRNLLREKQNIEMEIARLLARQSAIETQIIVIEKQIDIKLHSDPVTGELQQLVEMHVSQLALMERQFQAGTLGSVELAAIREKLTRAKIELAQRHEQLSKSAGGDQQTKYNNELADMTIEFAEKTAALQILSKQLGQTEQQLMAATMVDPQVSRIRQATRAFEIADQRIDELNTRSANLRPPVVSMLGGE